MFPGLHSCVLGTNFPPSFMLIFPFMSFLFHPLLFLVSLLIFCIIVCWVLLRTALSLSDYFVAQLKLPRVLHQACPLHTQWEHWRLVSSNNTVRPQEQREALLLPQPWLVPAQNKKQLELDFPEPWKNSPPSAKNIKAKSLVFSLVCPIRDIAL